MIGCLLFVLSLSGRSPTKAGSEKPVLEQSVFHLLSRQLNPTQVLRVADQGNCPRIIGGLFTSGRRSLSWMFFVLVRQAALELFRLTLATAIENCHGVFRFCQWLS